MKQRILLILFAVPIVIYVLWRCLGVYDHATEPAIKEARIESLGIDSLAEIAIVGIQPYMEASDFRSASAFLAALDSYFQQAQAAGLFKKEALVLLPEYIGTWLVVSEQRREVFKAETISRAMIILILDKPMRFLRHFWESNQQDRIKDAIFRMEAEKMAQNYRQALRELAMRYQVSIVGGSIVLPGARIEHDELLIDLSQPAENISIVFFPDGSLAEAITRKAFPIEEELSFTAPSSVVSLPVYTLANKTFFVGICADSWYPEVYQQALKLHAEIMLVPSFSSPAAMWHAPWGGYNGTAAPDDVNSEDIGNITEAEAWQKYALPGRAIVQGINYGLNVFLKGTLWDMEAGGDALVVFEGKTARIEDKGKGLIMALWVN